MRLIFVFCLIAAKAHAADSKAKPQDTQVWEPVPALVNPYPVPSDALILFDGRHIDAWTTDEDKPVQWAVQNGELQTRPNAKSIFTKAAFCDIQLHIEWKTPSFNKAEKNAQKQGNSGIFFQRRYELQVLNSYENPTYVNGQAAAIYKQSPPLVNASLPPNQWQQYDVIYHAPRFKENGELEKKANITVLHNGVLVQDHFELLGVTRHIGQPAYQAHGCAPILLQNHGQDISYRNIWVRPI